MNWQQARDHFPDQWVLFEALQAHTEENRRIVEQMAVINVFPDSESAMKGYLQLHRQFPGREFYVFHTRRESLDITVQRRVGIRVHA